VGGAAGAGARWAAGVAWGGGAGFPVATCVANLAGCLALGALLALGAGRRLSTRWVDALGVGFCGGLTTFSTLAVEAVDLDQGGRPGLAAAYVAVSVVGGVAAFLAGGRLATLAGDAGRPEPERAAPGRPEPERAAPERAAPERAAPERSEPPGGA